MTKVKQGYKQTLRQAQGKQVGKGYKNTKIGIIPEDWDVEKLGNIVNNYDAQRKPIKSDDRAKRQGDYRYFGASGVIDHIDDYIFEGEYILLGEDGANILDRSSRLSFLVDGKFWVNNHAHIYQAKKDKANNYFVSEYLESIRYEKYNTGSAQPKLPASTCNKIPIPLPPLPEQKKIAEVLSTWDEAIDKQQELIQSKKTLKKGLMQQLLTGEKRFSQFVTLSQTKGRHKDTDPETSSGRVANYKFKETRIGKVPEDWEVVRFDDIFQRVTRKNTENNLNVLTISGSKGLINQEEYFNKSVSAANVQNYYLIKKGEYAYNKSYSNGYPMGAIKRLDKYEKGVLSTLYICFKFSGKGIDNFFKQIFDFGLLNRQLMRVTKEGGRAHGLLNIAIDDFFGIELPSPSQGEQKKIAEVLSSADREIELLEGELVQMKEQKKGLMQVLLTGEMRVRL